MKLFELEYYNDNDGLKCLDYVVADDMKKAIDIIIDKTKYMGTNFQLGFCKTLADESLSDYGYLYIDKNYHDEMVTFTEMMIEFLEKDISEANMGDHELDCDGENCMLCDVRKLYNKLMGDNDIEQAQPTSKG